MVCSFIFDLNQNISTIFYMLEYGVYDKLLCFFESKKREIFKKLLQNFKFLLFHLAENDRRKIKRKLEEFGLDLYKKLEENLHLLGKLREYESYQQIKHDALEIFQLFIKKENSF